MMTIPQILSEECKKEYYIKMIDFLQKEKAAHTIYPPNPFDFISYGPTEDTKVVILAQDPYHNGQAHGLAFSAREGPIPASLKNIFKELEDDLGCYIPNHACLEKWAKQGVLLLNTVLTVRAGQPNSHKSIGWERLTNRIIEELNNSPNPLVFMLWGAESQKRIDLINEQFHLILQAPHPSPLSAYRGFFGCKHFSQANEFLQQHNLTPIDWQIENIDIQEKRWTY